MDWNFYSSRRKMKLEDFIRNAKTEDDALALFAKKQLTQPPLDEIRNLLSQKHKVSMVVKNEELSVKQLDPIIEQTEASVPKQDVIAKKTKHANGTPGN